MLKAIEPQYLDNNESAIDSFLGLLKIYQNFCLSPEEKDRATYIIAEDDKRGVYGGVILYPQKISPSLDLVPDDTYEEILGKMFSAFQPKGEEYWKARIGFYVGQDTSLPILETVKLCQRFYENLYEAFVVFGEKKGVEYLPFTLHVADSHLDKNIKILTYKTWPYLLEVRPAENSEKFFHGILSLKKNKFKLRKLQRVSSDLSTSTGTYPERRG